MNTNEIRIRDVETGATYKSLYELVSKNVSTWVHDGYTAIGLGFMSNIEANGMQYIPKNEDSPLEKLKGHHFIKLTGEMRLAERIAEEREHAEGSTIRDMTTGKTYSDIRELIQSHYNGRYPNEELWNVLEKNFKENIEKFGMTYCPVNQFANVFPHLAGHKFKYINCNREKVAANNIKNNKNENEKEIKTMTTTTTKTAMGGQKRKIKDLTENKVYNSISQLMRENSSTPIIGNANTTPFIENLQKNNGFYKIPIIKKNSKFVKLNGHQFAFLNDEDQEEVEIANTSEPIVENKAIIEDCIMMAPSKCHPEKIKKHHFRMLKEVVEFLQTQKDADGNTIILDPTACPIVNMTKGIFYNSIEHARTKLANESNYSKFFYEFDNCLLDEKPYNGELYSYVDQFTKDQLVNILKDAKHNELQAENDRLHKENEKLLAEIAECRHIIIQVSSSMENLHNLANIVNAKIPVDILNSVNK